MTHATELQQFRIPGGDGELRIILLAGEPWFVATDVARVLGHRDASTLARILKTGEKVPHKVRTPGGEQEILLISEAGFYRAVMRSNRPEADAFQTWVTGDVLPTIRKTGSYGAPTHVIPATFAEALELAAGQARALEAVTLRVAELEPAAEAHAALMGTDGSYSLAEAAQALGMGRDRFIEILQRFNLIIVRKGHSDHLRPYETARRAGHLTLKVRTFEQEHRDGRVTTETDTTTRVTPKGLEHVRKRLGADFGPTPF